MKAKPQTSDPGENHPHSDEKITGMADFTGQDPYDTDGGELAAGDDTEIPVRITDTSNKFNGSSGSRKVFSSGKVKGSNP